MKIRAYGLQKGDIFLHNDDRFTVTVPSKAGSHARGSSKKTEVMISANTLVEVVGSILPSRDADIKKAVDIGE